MTSINQWTYEWAKKNNLPSHYETQLTSTNEIAKKENGRATIYLTDEQSQGRGRGTNSWSHSQEGHTLLSTWCFQAVPPKPTFSARLGLTLYKSLKQVWPNEIFGLKAPNDIYLGDGKMAGLLVELEQMSDSCLFVIGLGLNVFSAPHLPEQTTAFLNHKDGVGLESWEQFCHCFYNGLLDLKTTSDQPSLTSTEQAELLLALNHFSKNNYSEVREDGSLKDSNSQWIHWTEL